MPQKIINNSQIAVFSFKVTFDIKNLKMVFDVSDTVFNGTGVDDCKGINFSVVDEGGVEHLAYNWTSPAILPVSTTANPKVGGTSTFELDLSDTFFYALFFQKWRIKGAIRDGNGVTYETNLVLFDVCKPKDFNEEGYIGGLFNVEVNCPQSQITVKDQTPLTYLGIEPFEKENDGVLSYPRGTIADVLFTFTPFVNNVVYTGTYAITNTLTAKYDIGNGGIVQLEYYTKNEWTFDCENNIANVLCCVYDLQLRADRNCNNAVGKEAQRQLLEITPMLLVGIANEYSGRDSSQQAKYIREKLRCDCGKQGVKKVSIDPVNTAIYNIMIEDAGATTVTSQVSGSSKIFTVSSRAYIVEKLDNNDTAILIQIDTQTPFATKYKIGLNYELIAGNILNEISLSENLLLQLNSLVTETFLDLSTLNGRCVIDITANDYFLSYRATANSNVVKSILIGTTTYNAPPALTVNNVSGITSWLNGLSLGTFNVSFSTSNSGAFLNVLSTSNSNVLQSMVITSSGDITVRFNATNKSLVAVLQAVIDYICELSASQMALGASITVCSFLNGQNSETTLGASATQAQLNSLVAAALCQIRNRITAVTTTTCNQIRALFIDRPANTLTTTGRLYGINDSGDCTSWTLRQTAMAIINTIKTDTIVFNNFCSIPECGEPVSCPDILGFTIIQLGDTLVLQSVLYSGFVTTSQTLTVRVREVGAPTYDLVTNSLSVGANGSVTPNLVVVPSVEVGNSYQVLVQNNCGGAGIAQIIEITSCPEPTNLNVLFNEETIPSSSYSAFLQWAGSASGTYDVEYREVGEMSWITASGSPVTGLSIFVDFLLYGVDYEWRVRRVCDTSIVSAYVNGENFVFTTNENAIFINNSGDIGITFTNVVDDSLLNPFDFISGTPFPLLNTEENLYNHTGFTGVLSVTYTPTSGGSFEALMYKNGVIIQSVPITTDGVTNIVSFLSETFAPTDILKIEIVQSV